MWTYKSWAEMQVQYGEEISSLQARRAKLLATRIRRNGGGMQFQSAETERLYWELTGQYRALTEAYKDICEYAAAERKEASACESA
jgi:hypothetical protein